ncbi:MAG TPA: hypothetical protein VFC19_15385 [Candidatus Limnocylindrales bacterium]|nr:hypothetical protein [Candidatus Limnocylindrales bacterium]
MAFTCGDLDELTGLVVEAWRAGIGRDWTVQAGTLEWSCLRTADHAVDTVFAPALFLASRKLDSYPTYGLFTPGADADPAVLIEALQTATRTLTAVVKAAGPSVRAVIWRRPEAETRPPEDFVPRGALELILHAHDVCAGLGIAFQPPDPLCERLRDHTADWPMWTAVPGWHPPAPTGPAWPALLHASGR